MNQCSFYYKCVKGCEKCTAAKQIICKLRRDVFEAPCPIMLAESQKGKNMNPETLKCNIIPVRLFFHENDLLCECDKTCVPMNVAETEKILRPYRQENSHMRVKKEEYPALKESLLKHFGFLTGEYQTPCPYKILCLAQTDACTKGQQEALGCKPILKAVKNDKPRLEPQPRTLQSVSP